MNGHAPYVVFPDWDYAENWGEERMREVHPFVPVIRSSKVSEVEFRARVREIHGP